MAKALDDAAQALVTEARGNNKLATLAPCTNADDAGRDLREDVHHVVRRQGVTAAPLTTDEVTRPA